MQPKTSRKVLRPLNMEMMDPFGAIISLLSPQAVQSKIVSGAGKWSIRKPRYKEPAFCLLLHGSCFLELEGVGALALKQGDFVFLTETPGFTLASDLSISPAPVGFDYSRETRYGAKSGPATMRMLGGYFRFDPANAPLLLRLLPLVIHIRREEVGAERVRRIVELIGDEADSDRPGRAVILKHLIEVLLVEVLRLRAASVAIVDQGLLAGLSDPALARAFREIHIDVARRWTVAELARTAGMSRALFAQRFASVVGLPPMQYVLEWRMAVAKNLLRRGRPSLAEVAEKVGYESASAFSTAFARLTGHAPSEFANSL